MLQAAEMVVHNALIENIKEIIFHLEISLASVKTEAILSATCDWNETLEERGSVACVFLDLAKTIDSLSHRLVLESLASRKACMFGLIT